jgi:lipopolysaccharide transport system permease protein
MINSYRLPWTFLQRAWSHLNPGNGLRELWKQRYLIRQFAGREISSRYQGTYLGAVWSLITPLLMLGVYTFVYGVIFKARWMGAAPGSTTGDGLASFALAMFSGTLVYSIFSETLNRSCGLIIGVPNFVKKVVFPLQILPLVTLIGSLFQAMVALVVLAIGMIIVTGSIPPTMLLAPVMILPIALFSLGLAWFCSSLGVYVRDIGHGVAIVTQVLFFATPIFYPIEAVPAAYRGVMSLNPLTPMVTVARQALLGQTSIAWDSYALSLAIGLIVAFAGYGWFQATRRGFADVL